MQILFGLILVAAIDRNAYTHLAYAIETTDSENSVIDERGIRFKNLRRKGMLKEKFPDLFLRLKENLAYYPEPPELVILMSATPFRSANQFTNLLRLLTHQTALKNAYAKDVGKKQLLAAISTEDSPVTVIWRQQDEIRNWSDKRLFPKLTIVRPHREGEPTLEKTDEEYLLTSTRNLVFLAKKKILMD